MTPYGPIFVLAVATGFAFTLLVRWGARRLGVVDAPDGFRKVHARAIPLLGGVAIFAAFFLSLLVCHRLTHDPLLGACLVGADFWALLGGATIVLLAGVWDDVWGLRARWKLLILGLVSVAMYASGYRIGGLSNPFGAPIDLGLLAVPLTVLWFLGCMNAINLIDGLDGLAAGVTVFAAATIFALGVLFGNTSAALLAIALAGAAIGFLLLNFHPASIYLGDSGSLLLGFLLACIGLRSAQKSTMVVALLIPVIALGLPIMDTALAILRRWSKALPFVAGDRQHIHHKLLELGFTHRTAVLMMYAACLLLCGLALLTTAANSRQNAALLAVMGLGTFLIVRVIGRHEIKLVKTRLTRYFERRRRGMQCRAAGNVASTEMRQAETVADMWDIFSHAARRMDLDRAEMSLFGPAGPRRGLGQAGRRLYLWGSDGQDRRDDDVLWSVVVPLQANGLRVGSLEVRKATNGHPLGPEIPETLDLLARALAHNLIRLQAESMPVEQLVQIRLW